MVIYSYVSLPEGINQQPEQTRGTSLCFKLPWAHVSNRGILSSPDLQHEAHGFTSGKGTVLGIGDA